jgi:hypothetical protein
VSNKLASNVAARPQQAGIHGRTDGIESLKLGEAVAISVLRDQRGTYNEDFAGFTLPASAARIPYRSISD